MAAKEKVFHRRLVLHSISAHSKETRNVLNYAHYFESMREYASKRENKESLLKEIFGQSISISDIRFDPEEDILGIRLVIGVQGEPISFFSTETNEENEITPSEGFYATGIWIFVDIHNRLLVQERRRPGIPVSLISRYFEIIGHSFGYPGFEIELSPIPNKQFARAIRALTRVREVEIDIMEPNHDWGDCEGTVIALAQESGASEGSVSVRAPHGKGLAKDKGIVKEAVDLAQAGRPTVKNLKITGQTPDSTTPQTINFKKFIMSLFADIPHSASPVQQFENLLGTASNLIAMKRVEDDKDAQPSKGKV
jgi:hypothetical protein